MKSIINFFKPIRLFQRYLRSQAYVDRLILSGHRLESRGYMERALARYRKAIQINPGYPRAHLSLGNAYFFLGLTEDAVTSYQKAIALDPEYASAYHNLGNAWRKLNHAEDAVSCYRKALLYNPECVEILVALGAVYEELNKIEQATLQYEAAVKIDPKILEAHFLLGEIYQKSGQLSQAIVCYRSALSLKPNHVNSHFGLGLALAKLGDESEAIDQLKITLNFKSDHIAAIQVIGGIFAGQLKYDEAKSCYQKVIDLDPEFVQAYYGMGSVLLSGGYSELALANYQKAIAIDNGYYGCYFGILSAQLRAVYKTSQDMSESRDRFIHSLSELEAFYCQHPDAKFDPVVVGEYFPFYLAYHEKNNREFLLRYGSLLTKIMENWYQKQQFHRNNLTADGKIRIGIVSSHIRDHSVWLAITNGLVLHLDSTRFEIFLFGIGKNNNETMLARDCIAGFIQGALKLQEWVDKIHAISPDILIYPEIGMESMTIKLASLKLAPTQIVAWGHPETTGISTIDYYWSSEMFEPAMAQENYSEQILLLPNLGCWYTPLDVPNVDINLLSLRIDDGIPILICPGTPMKYIPQYDLILVEIARRLGDCQFIFFDPPSKIYSLTHPISQLKSRIENSFVKAGLRFEDFVVFVPWQVRSEFYALLKKADVMLDTIGFSGFNTVMQAIECDLPVVTMDGQYMRGRLGSGILRRMKLTELIVSNQEEFVDLVVKIVQNISYRQAVRMKIKELKHVLFEDVAPIRWLEKFFLERSAITRACHQLGDSYSLPKKDPYMD